MVMPYSFTFAKGFGWGAELNVRYILKKPLPGKQGMALSVYPRRLVTAFVSRSIVCFGQQS